MLRSKQREKIVPHSAIAIALSSLFFCHENSPCKERQKETRQPEFLSKAVSQKTLL